MAKRKIEFRPDSQGTGLLGQLYVTPSQRRRILKWTLYSLIFVVALVLQDVIFSRIWLPGGKTDLVPAVLLLVCVLEGVENGGLFVLLCTVVYLFSGSAPGAYVILLLTGASMGAAVLRQGYLRRSFRSIWLCTALGLVCYELALWTMGFLMGATHPGRIGTFFCTGLWAAVVVPVLYPVLNIIGILGGEPWKE